MWFLFKWNKKRFKKNLSNNILPVKYAPIISPNSALAENLEVILVLQSSAIIYSSLIGTTSNEPLTAPNFPSAPNPNPPPISKLVEW